MTGLGTTMPFPDSQEFTEGAEFRTFPSEAVKLLIANGLVPARDIRVNHALVERSGKILKGETHRSDSIGVERGSKSHLDNDRERLNLAVTTQLGDSSLPLSLVDCSRGIIKEHSYVKQIELTRDFKENTSTPCEVKIQDHSANTDVILTFDDKFHLIYIDFKFDSRIGAAEINHAKNQSTIKLVGYTSGPFKNNDFNNETELLGALNMWLKTEVTASTKLDFNSMLEAMLQFNEKDELTDPLTLLRINE